MTRFGDIQARHARAEVGSVTSAPSPQLFDDVGWLLDRVTQLETAARVLQGEAVLEQDVFDENVAVRISIGPWRSFSAALDTEQPC